MKTKNLLVIAGKSFKSINVIAAFIFMIMLLPCLAYSQNKIHYTYDTAGNRISRTIVLNTVQKMAAQQEETIPVYRDLFADMNISIYPNPTKGQLIVQIDGLKTEQSVDIILYDMTGKIILKKTKVSATTDIDITGQAPGSYILKFFCGESTTEWKIIKE
jgi:hypothetical protein